MKICTEVFAVDQETVGKVISISKQWWLKVNKQPIRVLGTDGAVYPYIVRVAYTVNGKNYTKRKWIRAGKPVPPVGASVPVIYDGSRPAKAKVFL